MVAVVKHSNNGPRVMRRPLSVADSWRFIDAVLASPSLSILVETDRHSDVASQVFYELPHLQGNIIHDAHTAILRRLESDVEAVRLDAPEGKIELPVKLKVHDSIFVPLAKWAMLLAGNYRCVLKGSVRPIKDAVHSDLAATRAVYEWVVTLCVSLGADRKDLVPFDKYANAALSLGSPSSAARALANGAPNIERVDRLVKTIAAQKGMRSDVVDETVALVDGWLEMNRKKG